MNLKIVTEVVRSAKVRYSGGVRLPRFCLCPMWSPSLRAPPLLAGACFLSFVSAFGLPPRRRRFAPSPVGGCVLPVLFRGCRLRRRCPFSLVRPPLWRRCSALCVRALSVPHATSRAFRCAAGRRGRPFLSPSQSREPHIPRLRRASGAKSAGFQNSPSRLMRRRAARGFQFWNALRFSHRSH